MRARIPDNWNSRCKGPEIGVCLVLLGSSTKSQHGQMAKAMGAIASTSTFTQSEMKSSHRRIWGQGKDLSWLRLCHYYSDFRCKDESRVRRRYYNNPSGSGRALNQGASSEVIRISQGAKDGAGICWNGETGRSRIGWELWTSQSSSRGVVNCVAKSEDHGGAAEW